MNNQGTIRCIEDEEALMDDLIAHVMFEPKTNTYMTSNDIGHEEVAATLIPFSLHPDSRQVKDSSTAYATRLRINPDSEVIICLYGVKHLEYMEQSERNLIPSKKKKGVHAEEFSLLCHR